MGLSIGCGAGCLAGRGFLFPPFFLFHYVFPQRAVFGEEAPVDDFE
jgi:hypothetical protein